MDADERGAFIEKLIRTDEHELCGRVFVENVEEHESCKHSKFCLSPLNLEDCSFNYFIHLMLG